jgi:hypothetical protein
MLEEPKGWKCLQELAQREKDPRRLAQIIDQMNQLLTEQERAAADEERPSARSSRRKPIETSDTSC